MARNRYFLIFIYVESSLWTDESTVIYPIANNNTIIAMYLHLVVIFIMIDLMVGQDQEEEAG